MILTSRGHSDTLGELMSEVRSILLNMDMVSSRLLTCSEIPDNFLISSHQAPGAIFSAKLFPFRITLFLICKMS